MHAEELRDLLGSLPTTSEVFDIGKQVADAVINDLAPQITDCSERISSVEAKLDQLLELMNTLVN